MAGFPISDAAVVEFGDGEIELVVKFIHAVAELPDLGFKWEPCYAIAVRSCEFLVCGFDIGSDLLYVGFDIGDLACGGVCGGHGEKAF